MSIRAAYERIFTRGGLNFKAIDPGEWDKWGRWTKYTAFTVTLPIMDTPDRSQLSIIDKFYKLRSSNYQWTIVSLVVNAD